MQTALLLFALGFGYKIFSEAARKNEKTLKGLGKVVGAIIMVISFLGSICTITASIQRGNSGCLTGFCPTHHQKTQMSDSDDSGYSHSMNGSGAAKKKMMCPMMGGMSQDSEGKTDSSELNKDSKKHY